MRGMFRPGSAVPLALGNAWSVRMAEDGLTFERVQPSPALPEASTPPRPPPLTPWALKQEMPQDARSSPRGWTRGCLPLDLKHGSHNSNQVAGVCISDEGGKARKTSQKWEKREIGPLFPISLVMRLQKTGLSTFPCCCCC